MKERPILFSAPMVRALLEGRKTQTRRVVNPQPDVSESFSHVNPPNGPFTSYGHSCWYPDQLHKKARHYGSLEHFLKGMPQDFSPYGEPGDLLYVKEAYYAWGKWVPNGQTKVGRPAWKFVQAGTSVRYMDGNKPTKTATRDGECGWVYRHGRFMPRKHSRITLEITDVRVQRLQDISGDDAVAEGIIKLPATGRYVAHEGAQYFGWVSHNAVEVYSWLWESINGKGSWATNSWVWAVSFKMVKL